MACAEKNHVAGEGVLSVKPTAMQALMAEKAVKLPNQNNPIMAHKFAADPAVLVYKDAVYVYATNDMQQAEYSQGKEDNKFDKINSLTVFMSRDLVNWTDLGEIAVAGKNGGKGDAKWATNCWAPAVAWKNINGKDRFFIYFADNGNGIGVVSADSPTGPFTDPIKRPLVSRQTPNCANVTWLFDPAVLVDADGKGYLYFGGGHSAENFAHPKTARCVALGDDMTSIAGTPMEIDAPYLFEDSGINKIGDTWYYTYCANWTARPAGSGDDVPPVAVIAYMTSENPLGPFVYKGWTLKNPGTYFGAWGNNHHWIFDFQGKHYIAYHTQTLEKQAGFEKGGYRGIFINEFAVNDDGSLPVQEVALDGVKPACNFNAFERIPASTFHSFRNVAVTSCQTVRAVRDGGYVCIKNVDFDSAKKIVMEFAAVPGADGKSSASGKSASGGVKVCIDHFGANGTVLAEVKSGKKLMAQENLAEAAGVHDLYFVFSGDAELVSWQMEK